MKFILLLSVCFAAPTFNFGQLLRPKTIAPISKEIDLSALEKGHYYNNLPKPNSVSKDKKGWQHWLEEGKRPHTVLTVEKNNKLSF